MSDNTTRDFLIACAQTAKSPADLLKSFGAMDIPTNNRTQSFAQELFQRTPRIQSSRSFMKSVTAGAGGTGTTTVMSASEAKKKRKEENANLRLLEMNDAYGLILDEDDNEENRTKSKKSKKSSKGKEEEKDSFERSRKRDKKIRRKEGGDDAWESDEEEKEYKRSRLEELNRESRPTKTEGKMQD